MADYLEQIPGFEKGTVQCVCATDAESALYLGAQMVSDLLSKWFTNVAYFSLLGHAEALQALVRNTAGFTRLHAVNQKNPNLQVILNKAQGMVNRKFVRAVIIEGLPAPDPDGWRLLQTRAQAADIPIVLLNVADGGYSHLAESHIFTNLQIRIISCPDRVCISNNVCCI